MRQNADTDKMVAEVLSHHDVLASVLCVDIATEAVIEYLVHRMPVSKAWYAHITRLLRNASWLAPFVRSVQRFVVSMAARQADMRALGNGIGADIRHARSSIIEEYVDGMYLHMFDANAQCSALSTLKLIIRSHALGIQDLTSISTAMNKAMDTHSSAPKVQAAACAVIQDLADRRLYAKTLLGIDTVRKVILFMRMPWGSRYVLFSVHALFWSLRFLPNCVLNYFPPTCTLTKSMAYLFDSAVARITVSTLCSMMQFPSDLNTYGEHIVRVVFETGAIALVVSLLQTHDDDILLFAKFLDFVKSVAPHQLTTLVQCRAHDIIILRMEQTLPPAVLKSSMYALGAIVHNQRHTAAIHSGIPDSLFFFDTNGGVDMVLGYLQAPSHNDHIDVAALHLVRSLISNYPELVPRMCARGLVPLLFAVLKRKSAGNMQSIVLHDVVSIVYEMTENRTHIHFVAKEIVMTLLFVVMKKFQLLGPTMPLAMTAICNLTNLHDTTRRAAAPEHLVRYVVDTIRLYKNSLEFQQTGMRTLLCFLGSWRNVDEVISSGGVVCLLRAMCKFSNDPSIAQDSLMAISIIAQRDSQREHMLNTEHEAHDGIIVCTLNLMLAHEAQLLVQRPAVGLLAKLAVGRPSLYADLRNAGAIFALSRVLQLPDVDTTTRKMALKLLKACAPVL